MIYFINFLYIFYLCSNCSKATKIRLSAIHIGYRSVQKIFLKIYSIIIVINVCNAFSHPPPVAIKNNLHTLSAVQTTIILF